jgi:hypothetical protein
MTHLPLENIHIISLALNVPELEHYLSHRMF